MCAAARGLAFITQRETGGRSALTRLWVGAAPALIHLLAHSLVHRAEGLPGKDSKLRAVSYRAISARHRDPSGRTGTPRTVTVPSFKIRGLKKHTTNGSGLLGLGRLTKIDD